jgi:hypothetical protein
MSGTAKAIQQRGAATEAAVTTYARSCFVCPASRRPVMQGTPADSCVRSGRPAAAQLTISIVNLELTTRPVGAWRAISTAVGAVGFVESFPAGISPFSISFTVKDCSCVAYSSPYLEVSSPIVTGESAPKAQVYYHIYPVSMTRVNSESEVDLSLFLTHADYQVESSNPAVNSPSPDDWVWPEALSGNVTAIDLAARDQSEDHTFYSGVAFGLAAAAAIGCIQEGFAIRKPRRRVSSLRAVQPSRAPERTGVARAPRFFWSAVILSCIAVAVVRRNRMGKR